jgi:branched-subunit amino acid aminotransferase/4-amino-4-deoxychorismate lyase
MLRPFAFRNREFLSERDVAVPLSDAGFVLGTTVTEQLRTFGGRLFHLDDHLRRLQQSLQIVGIDAGMTRGQLASAAGRLTALNVSEVRQRDDLGLSIFVTPGPFPTLTDGKTGEPLVCMHTYKLPFALWSEKYESGQALVTTDVRQVATNNWPPALKCRSRMHYWLADRAAAARQPGARALLQDADGFILETSSANVLVYFESEGLVSPPREKVLPGISLAVLSELAGQLGIPHSERDLTPDDVSHADEVLICSTPYCLLPVTQFNGQPIADSRPGEVFRKLLSGWSAKVGIDIAKQARQFANRDS